MPTPAGLTEAQIGILRETAGGGDDQWWSAMEVVEKLGRGSGPGVGCAMKGLVKRGLLRYRAMSRKEGRLQATYQITDAGRRVLDLELARSVAS